MSRKILRVLNFFAKAFLSKAGRQHFYAWCAQACSENRTGSPSGENPYLRSPVIYDKNQVFNLTPSN